MASPIAMVTTHTPCTIIKLNVATTCLIKVFYDLTIGCCNIWINSSLNLGRRNALQYHYLHVVIPLYQMVQGCVDVLSYVHLQMFHEFEMFYEWMISSCNFTCKCSRTRRSFLDRGICSHVQAQFLLHR